MMRNRCALLLFAIGTNANAFEAYVTNPGTRAMGMAGMFAAQADDSSAIWYNPGGLGRRDMVKRDFTFEWGGIPAANTQHGFSNDPTLKFVGAYAGDLWNKPALGVGMAYVVPYELSFDVTHWLNPLSAQTYGEITATYRQFSSLIATQLRPDLAIGATLDWVWISVRCTQSPCVNYGPSGIGMSLGATYELAQHEDWTTTLAAVWHSRAALGYSTEATSGIGTFLGDYLPDRPQSLHFGAGLKIPGRYAVWNTNIGIEKRFWSSAAGTLAPADNFTRVGIAEEALMPLSLGRSIALRVGWVQAHADGGSNQVTIFATGLGVSFAQHHSLDLALERRVLNNTLDAEASYASFSYSWQL